MADPRSLLASGQDVLTREAVFLDERRWDEWLAMYAPNCEYWVPTWRSEEVLTDDPQTELSHIYYASRAGLEDRIARIRTGKSPASSPLRRTTHMLGNVMLLQSRKVEWLQLRSSWTCHLHDPHSKQDHVLHGHSLHELTLHAAGWLITRRKTVIQNDVLPSMIDIYCL